jgi:xanthine dehydrogenase accessory factor
MRHDLLILAADLVRRGEPFALATVVRRQPASSSQTGDGALVTGDGAFHGWLGGSCTQPTVVREALRALSDGSPRLIALSPEPEKDRRPGVLVFPMTCHSGGTVDIYLEPVLPPSRFLVFGASPVARALSRMARAMGFVVDVADPGADRAVFPEADRLWTDLGSVGPRPGSFAVVATMGERDEEAVRAAIAAQPGYLGVVASGKRFAKIRESLLAAGVPSEALGRIKSPAGLDIGARTPEEIAVSILAEIVKVRREASPTETVSGPELPRVRAREERDTVCGMTVAVTPQAIRAEIGGRAYYFCCGGCRERFLAAPERFVAAGGAA